jgi:hypothetical protein
MAKEGVVLEDKPDLPISYAPLRRILTVEQHGSVIRCF